MIYRKRVTIMQKMRKDEKGQMSIDFLVGMSLFMLALIFLVLVIQGMFLPFQTETIDLNSVAYRTSVILVEDPGWGDKGTDWEKQNIENVSRIGLAIDKAHPNMLDMKKLAVFENKTLINNANLARKLGLYRHIGNSDVYYGYNITIADLNDMPIATRGASIPDHGDVSSMKRIVKAQTGTEIVIVELMGAPPENKKARFNTTDPEGDIVMVIKGVVVRKEGNPELKFVNVDNEGNKLVYGVDYWVWIMNETDCFELQTSNSPNPKLPDIPLPDVPYNATAKLKIKIRGDVLHAGENLIEVKFDHIEIQESGCVNLDELERIPIYEVARLRVNIW